MADNDNNREQLKLYNIPRRSVLFVHRQGEEAPVRAIFDHLDGMYSFCYLEEDKSIFHLAGRCPVLKVEGGYKVSREDLEFVIAAKD